MQNQTTTNKKISNDRYLQKIWSDDDIRSFIYVLIWAVICGYFTGVTNAIADNLQYKNNKSKPYENNHIIDLGFQFSRLLLNNVNIATNSHDITLYSVMFFTFLFILFGPLNNKRIIVWRRWILMFDILFTLRILMITTTTFPLPYNYNNLPLYCSKWDNVFYAPLEMLIKNRMACHDFFFSGHMVNCSICVLILTKYSRYYSYKLKKEITILKYIIYLIRIIAWLALILLILFLLYLQIHYTIDILIAIILTILFWILLDYEIELMKGWLGYWNIQKDYSIKDKKPVLIQSNKDEFDQDILFIPPSLFPYCEIYSNINNNVDNTNYCNQSELNSDYVLDL